MEHGPRFQRQLVSSIATAGHDCGVRSTSMAIDFATFGRVLADTGRGAQAHGRRCRCR